MLDPATIRLVPDLTWRTDAAALDSRLIRLLIGIEKHATLRAAARDTGLSYRAAWGLLGETGRVLGVPLAELHRGRGARLTEAGEQLLAANARALRQLRDGAFAVEIPVPRQRRRQRDRTELTVAASHDLLLAAFCERWARPEGVVGELAFKGSVDSLKTYAAGEADVAGFHAVVTRSDRVTAGLRRLLDPRRDTLIRFAERDQGLIVRRGNPERLGSLADIAARRVRFVNRQRGSGTRLLIDQMLRQGKIAPASILGYDTEEHTHLAVAATIATGQAEVGFGLRAAAARFALDFVPLQKEIYWLTVRSRRVESDAIKRLRAGLTGAPLRDAAHGLAGYSILDAGTMVLVTTATG